MSSIRIPAGVKKLFVKYRIPILILLLGLLLLSLPGGGKEDQREESPSPMATQMQPTLEEELETLLRQVDGAGKVSVMLTVEEGEYTVLQADRVTEERTSAQGEEDTTLREETVLVNAGSGRSECIPVQVRGPVYRGAVVVAEGADRASVRLDLISAVRNLTGLKADKITVIKMKAN